MEQEDPIVERQKKIYLGQLLALKTEAIYFRHYAQYVARWARTITLARAVLACAAILAWLLWKDLARLWGSVLVLCQVADTCKDVLPFTSEADATQHHASLLEGLFVQCEREWQGITSGPCTRAEMEDKLRRLRLRRLETENGSHALGGLRRREALQRQAEQEAREYFGPAL
jgi:hypothetical protein